MFDKRVLGNGCFLDEDPRNKKYLIAGSSTEERYKEDVLVPIGENRYDQEDTQSCVGHAFRHALEASPALIEAEFPGRFAIWNNAKKLDNMGDWEKDRGTTPGAAARFLKKVEVIKSYRWGWDYKDLMSGLYEESKPVIVATRWFSDMYYPGCISKAVKVSGEKKGHHAYLLIGRERQKKGKKKWMLRFLNSYGAVYGDYGQFFIPESDFKDLFSISAQAVIIDV